MTIDQSSFMEYQKSRREHWDKVARMKDTWTSGGGYYHKRLSDIYKYLIPPNERVLEIGCGTGDLLACLKPSYGVGVDFSPEMIGHARTKYPHLKFIECDTHNLDSLDEQFGVIILSDLVNDLWDVQQVFKELLRLSTPRTRVIINVYSRMWELPLKAAQQMKLMTPLLPQNWFTVEDISGLLDLADFEVLRHWTEIITPLYLPLISTFANRYIAKLWPFRYFALTNFIIARPRMKPQPGDNLPLVSVIVPARNEAGHIDEIIQRIPEMGRDSEIIFVEGNSTDDTYEVIEKCIRDYPKRKCTLFKQTGRGKGDAVRLGFEKAEGEILMILDADITVPPEDLPRFYNALMSGKCDFANGVRLVYPMEKQAMRHFNLIGNKFFSLAFSWLLGQPIKDTLCGTKVLWRHDYERIVDNRSYFGDFDPFGDFDLIFGAARLNLKIIDIPIRYKERKYGTTNIQRWKHGWLLLKMVLFAMRRIKFV